MLFLLSLREECLGQHHDLANRPRSLPIIIDKRIDVVRDVVVEFFAQGAREIEPVATFEAKMTNGIGLIGNRVRARWPQDLAQGGYHQLANIVLRHKQLH
jgi:hypothetical protein